MSAAVPSLAAPSLCLGPMLGLGLAAPMQGGGWWPRGALYAADFRKHRYMTGGRSITPAAAFSLTRGGEALAPDSTGSYQGFAAHVPARTDLGLFLSPAVSNAIADSTGTGASLSTTDTLNGLPGSWGQSRVDGSTIRARITAKGSFGGLPYVDVRFWGNSTATDLQLYFSNAEDQHLGITAGSSAAVLSNLNLVLAAGSLGNVTCRLRLTELAAGNVYLTKQLETVVPSAAALELAHFSKNWTVQNSGTSRLRFGLELTLSGAFDLTLRIAGAHLELSPAASLSARGLAAPVPTRGSPVLRPADALTLHLPQGTRSVTLTAATAATLTLDTSAATAAGPAGLSVPESPFGAAPLVTAVGWR